MAKRNKQQASGKGFGRKAESKHIYRIFDTNWVAAVIKRESRIAAEISPKISFVPLEFKHWLELRLREWADCDDILSDTQLAFAVQILSDFRLVGRYSAVEIQRLLIEDEFCEHLCEAFDELVCLFDEYLEFV